MYNVSWAHLAWSPSCFKHQCFVYYRMCPLCNLPSKIWHNYQVYRSHQWHGVYFHAAGPASPGISATSREAHACNNATSHVYTTNWICKFGCTIFCVRLTRMRDGFVADHNCDLCKKTVVLEIVGRLVSPV